MYVSLILFLLELYLIHIIIDIYYLILISLHYIILYYYWLFLYSLFYLFIVILGVIFNNPLKIAVPIIKNIASNIHCNSKQKYSVHNDKVK